MHWEKFVDRTLEHIPEIALTLIVALVLATVLRRLVTKLAERSIRRHDDDARRAARLRTLASVARSAISIVVWTWAVLVTLGSIGVDVRPILASAGVVGVAVGFGAQSLVKDFLSGIFMLIEDQYGVGDWVDVGDASGEVEAVSLRTTTIRDSDGTEWFVRNGQINRVGNFSRGYAVARLDVPLSLSSNIAVASETILAAAQAAADGPLKAMVRQAPELDGVADISTDHMIIRVKAVTEPGQQWAVKRGLLAAIIPALEQAQVAMPYPNGIGITKSASSN